MRTFIVVAALLLVSASVRAEPTGPQPQVGDRFEVKLERTSQGSTGSSFTRNTLVERVLAVREDGLELEFDLSERTQQRQWQFPVRVFRPNAGSLQLLNGEELDARLSAWLVAAGIPRTACGRWIFTWTAYQIECDPQSAVRIAEQFDLRTRAFSDGAPYLEEGALEPAPLRRTTDESGGVVFSVLLKIDPETLRNGRAERDVIVAEMMGEQLSAEDAASAHAQEVLSGTVSVTFEMDPAGDIQRLTRTTDTKITTADGSIESSTTTETITRTRLESP